MSSVSVQRLLGGLGDDVVAVAGVAVQPVGVVGFPTTNEQSTTGRPGAYNHFQAGSIYWSPATGRMRSAA